VIDAFVEKLVMPELDRRCIHLHRRGLPYPVLESKPALDDNPVD
jgi:hypothetical protein